MTEQVKKVPIIWIAVPHNSENVYDGKFFYWLFSKRFTWSRDNPVVFATKSGVSPSTNKLSVIFIVKHLLQKPSGDATKLVPK